MKFYLNKRLLFLFCCFFMVCMGITQKPLVKPPKPVTITNEDGEWVDLGLSVLWATKNLGASNTRDYGGYFGIDVDSYYLGKKGRPRLPTEEEFKELISKCSLKIVYGEPYRGYRIIGSNGNYMSFPTDRRCFLYQNDNYESRIFRIQSEKMSKDSFLVRLVLDKNTP